MQVDRHDLVQVGYEMALRRYGERYNRERVRTARAYLEAVDGVNLLLAAEMDMGAVALAYTGAFLGVLLSPLHLCFSLTRDYFKAEWGQVYKMVVPSVALVAAAVVALYVLA